MANTPEQMAQSMIENLPAKTGKSLKQWLAVCRKASLDKHGQIVAQLKQEYGITHGFANLIAHQYRATLSDAAAPSDPVAAQYAGAKADLKPIYDALIQLVSAFGSDVEIAPKKAYVSLRRSKQFGLIQPSTRTRVDLGLNLGDTAPGGRLEASGSFNAMVSHRVRLENPKQVNAELKKWLRAAYNAA